MTCCMRRLITSGNRAENSGVNQRSLSVSSTGGMPWHASKRQRPDLGTVVRGSKRRRAVQTERYHAVGIAPSVRGPDHPAERVTCEMRFLDVQFPPQSLHILDEIIKRIRRLW